MRPIAYIADDGEVWPGPVHADRGGRLPDAIAVPIADEWPLTIHGPVAIAETVRYSTKLYKAPWWGSLSAAE